MTLLTGADAAGHPSGAALKASGIAALGFYLTGANADAPAHLKDLEANGIWAWAIFEVGANAAARGHAGGVTDAQSGLAAARNDGIPKGASITLADDNSSVPYATVEQYWQGAGSVLRPAGYLNGGYGPHADCAQGLAAKAIDCAFVAGGWEDGQPETGIAIKQLVAQRVIGGVTVDMDQVLLPDKAGLFMGQKLWTPPAPPPVPKPVESAAAHAYAIEHGMVQIDRAEAVLAATNHPHINWYLWNGKTMVGHAPVNAPTGEIIYGFASVLDAAGISHAGA